MMKNPETPCQLSFYLFQNTIYFSRSSGEGLPHQDLWKKLVVRAFSKLAYENKVELFNYCYGTPRGRVVYRDDIRKWVLYGTSGCESVKAELIRAFVLENVPLLLDFRTDLHYRTIGSHIKAVEDSLKLIGIPLLPNTEITGMIEL